MRTGLWRPVIISLVIGFLFGCGATPEPIPASVAEEGTLAFVANGEDFVRQGFISKDGWAINFDQVLVRANVIGGKRRTDLCDRVGLLAGEFAKQLQVKLAVARNAS